MFCHILTDISYEHGIPGRGSIWSASFNMKGKYQSFVLPNTAKIK